MFMNVVKRSQISLMPFSRCFASMSAAEFSAVKREDVVGATDTKWMSKYVQSVAEQGDASGAQSDSVNEYFRKNFRKLSTEQAMDLTQGLYDHHMKSKQPVACLDDKFWVWETIEEALRAEVDNLSAEDFDKLHLVFCLNLKGSVDFLDVMEQRIYRDNGDYILKMGQ